MRIATLWHVILRAVQKPTVCLDVITLVARSCGYDRGQIEQLVAHELAMHWATHGESREMLGVTSKLG
jgi:hypothetical protein